MHHTKEIPMRQFLSLSVGGMSMHNSFNFDKLRIGGA